MRVSPLRVGYWQASGVVDAWQQLGCTSSPTRRMPAGSIPGWGFVLISVAGLRHARLRCKAPSRYPMTSQPSSPGAVEPTSPRARVCALPSPTSAESAQPTNADRAVERLLPLELMGPNRRPSSGLTLRYPDRAEGADTRSSRELDATGDGPGTGCGIGSNRGR